MSLATLKEKVERLIEKAQNAGNEIDIEQYEFFKKYVLGELSGDIVIPDYFKPNVEITAFQYQPNVTSLDTGYLTEFPYGLGDFGTYGITGLPNCEKIHFRNFNRVMFTALTNSPTSKPQWSMSKLKTIEFGKIATRMDNNWFKRGQPVPVTTVIIPKGWYVSLYLNNFTELTSECLHAIIENLADMTGKTAPKLYAGTNAIAKIDAEHIAMLENKNWTYS